MDITSVGFWTAIGVAILCGTVIGIERQLRGKPAGIRTSILICLGTCLFIRLGVGEAGPGTDSTRVLGQVVTGIGFLGAGVIFARGGTVVGITSAAVIWLLAAIGAMIGFERYVEAIVIAFIAVVLLAGIKVLEGKMSGLRKGVYAPEQDESDKMREQLPDG
jgi:putative Mg2+ transporter-C (MgtC) family protein